MRDKEKKHRKGQEFTIGKIIYGFLLFMPLIAIGGALLISTFNQSAKEETEIHYKYETNEVTSLNDFKQGNLYAYDNRVNQLFPSDYLREDNINIICKLIYCEFDTFFSYDDNYSESLNNYYDSIYISINDYFTIKTTNKVISNINNDYQIYTQDMLNEDVNTQYIIFEYQYFDNMNNINNLDTFLSCIRGLTNEELNQFQIIESVETHNLDTQEVFYRAIDKVTESSLFSWAENSIIYTTTNNTCNTLSITTPFIPLLLAYWLNITVIYFLYDIALMLVWMLHKKIHELQESL